MKVTSLCRSLWIPAILCISVQAQTWTATKPLNNPRWAMATAQLPSGRILAVGGHADKAGGYQSVAEIYDPVDDTWTPVSSMPLPHRLNAVTLSTGEVMVLGDDSNEESSPTAFLYNEWTDTWTQAASPSIIRYAPIVVALPNGKVLHAAGYDGHCCTTVGGTYISAEVYDRTTDTWTPTDKNLSQARTNATGTLLPNGRVLIAGGIQRDTVTLRRNLEFYDPILNTFTTKGTLLQGRFNHSATLLPNGYVLIAGGSSAVNTFLNSAELCDMNGTCKAMPNMPVARASHRALLLPSGRVMITGGQVTATGTTNSVVLFDPLTNTWSTTSGMREARAGHLATMLWTGDVLVSGGQRIIGQEIGTAELYDSLRAVRPLRVRNPEGAPPVPDPSAVQ